jgi:hypothetical protein
MQDSADHAKEAAAVMNGQAAAKRQDLAQIEQQVAASVQLFSRLQTAHEQMVNSASLALMSAALRSKADDIATKAMLAGRRAGEALPEQVVIQIHRVVFLVL